MRKFMVVMARSLLTDVSLKGDAMRSSKIDLAVFTCVLFLLAFAPSVSVAQEVTISAQSNNDFGDWKWANNCVEPGDYLLFSNASGTWGEGGGMYGPTGSPNPWTDNFLNLTDLGVGPYEAKTPTKYQDALVGYIGSSPPARGSYTSPNVRPEAERVFPVFPVGVTSSYLKVMERGCLWLAFNADAYSNYTVDNSGTVKVFIQPDTRWRPKPDVAPVCQFVPELRVKVICWVANWIVGGSIAR